jgi:transcription initiation factor TFIID subunit 7
MPPGPDCDYLKKAIEEGTVGLGPIKGGANVSLRMLDTLGRRGILKIRGNQYATTLVDLPCIIEGMKSWDKKGWIKSIDVCQMLLVLGRCYTDDEARNYPLPPDIDPKNYQYAHGLTPPMKWVRKRRFARTKRARVDDIEATERRVNALLEADRAAISTRYQLLDHDPRLDEERYSSGLEDEDAEGEDDDMDDYFGLDNDQQHEAPMFTETPVEDIGQDEVDEFERMLAGDDEEPTVNTNPQAQNTLHPPEPADSSFAVTSTSASPMATAAQTPASAADHTSDDDEDGAEDLDDDEREAKEELNQAKEKIASFEKKIEEHMQGLKGENNAILKRRRAQIIQGLKQDIADLKRKYGLGGDEDDE